MKKKAALHPTSEACQSKGQAIGMWETHGLMTRIDKAIFRTICKRRPFNYCINRRKVRDSISSPFPQRGCSTNGRPLALHARGTGVDAPHLQSFRGARQSKKEIWEAVLLDQKKTWIWTSTMQKEASETVKSLLRKRLVSRITKVYLRKTSKETLLYW